jgi:hypothetical protein
MELFACSGPGAGAAISWSIKVGYIQAAVVGGMLLASLFVFTIGVRRTAVSPAVLVGLLVLHPAWTVSAIRGDCGELKVLASCAFTCFGGAALGYQVFRSMRKPWSSKHAFIIPSDIEAIARERFTVSRQAEEDALPKEGVKREGEFRDRTER